MREENLNGTNNIDCQLHYSLYNTVVRFLFDIIFDAIYNLNSNLPFSLKVTYFPFAARLSVFTLFDNVISALINALSRLNLQSM